MKTLEEAKAAAFKQSQEQDNTGFHFCVFKRTYKGHSHCPDGDYYFVLPFTSARPVKEDQEQEKDIFLTSYYRGMQFMFQANPISVEEMLEREEKAYNPQTWKEAVLRYANHEGNQFYVIEPGEVYSYARFYASYIIEGVYFFKDFSAYSSCLSNAGFCKVRFGENGEVYKELFRSETGEMVYAKNCEASREYFREWCTPVEVMVSNSL